jgi:predicted metal-binding protein
MRTMIDLSIESRLFKGAYAHAVAKGSCRSESCYIMVRVDVCEMRRRI